MKYFIDTEFIEGFRKPLFGKKRHFIDLISIGIVCEDGREYYAISKEFNYKDADEWVQKNVIMPILKEEIGKFNNKAARMGIGTSLSLDLSAITVIQKFKGKTNEQIAREIRDFVFPTENDVKFIIENGNIEFWGYYADYDWVVFCSLFGRMIDLPKGFPMYCKDIKQLMDETGLGVEWKRSHCPDPNGEHNALIDARWNKKLYEECRIAEQIKLQAQRTE